MNYLFRASIFAVLVSCFVPAVYAKPRPGICSYFVQIIMGSRLGKQSEIDDAQKKHSFNNWTRSDFNGAIKSRYRLQSDSLMVLLTEALKKYNDDISLSLNQSSNISTYFSGRLNEELSGILSLVDGRLFRATRSSKFQPSGSILNEFLISLRQAKDLVVSLKPVRPSSNEPEPDDSWTSAINIDREHIYRMANSGWLDYYQANAPYESALRSIQFIADKLFKIMGSAD